MTHNYIHNVAAIFWQPADNKALLRRCRIKLTSCPYVCGVFCMDDVLVVDCTELYTCAYMHVMMYLYIAYDVICNVIVHDYVAVMLLNIAVL